MINLLERYKTVLTSKVTSLPVIILMPYSSCNCRCMMCDIWKDNRNIRLLELETVIRLMSSFRKLNTKLITLSGGEALLHPQIREICKLLKKSGMKISILSTGLTVNKNADTILNYTDELILSLDGPPEIHNHIRNISRAYEMLAEGVKHLYELKPAFRITSRTVIQKENFRHWPEIIETALLLGIKQCSFLPADVSSAAFNRPQTWEDEKQKEILLSRDECNEMEQVINELAYKYRHLFNSGYIAESPEKLQKIVQYYRAFSGEAFPLKKCNAPWVSTVIEADGNVRHCFFHGVMGNIYDEKLEAILNKAEAIGFRKQLDTDKDPVCEKCVCYLHLKPYSMT